MEKIFEGQKRFVKKFGSDNHWLLSNLFSLVFDGKCFLIVDIVWCSVKDPIIVYSLLTDGGLVADVFEEDIKGL